jgi:hypothetical protein
MYSLYVCYSVTLAVFHYEALITISVHLVVCIYTVLAEIPGVARDSRKSERIRVICLSPGSEYSLHQVWFESVKELKS